MRWIKSKKCLFSCSHFQCKLSEQSHWRRHWRCECLNFTGWGFCPRPLCISLRNNNTKTMNTPFKVILIETENWASIYPSSNSKTFVLDPTSSLFIWIISTAIRGITINNNHLISLVPIKVTFGNKTLKINTLQPNPTKVCIWLRTSSSQLSEKKLQVLGDIDYF